MSWTITVVATDADERWEMKVEHIGIEEQPDMAVMARAEQAAREQFPKFFQAAAARVDVTKIYVFDEDEARERRAAASE